MAASLFFMIFDHWRMTFSIVSFVNPIKEFINTTTIWIE
jgi:hypothetical protein